MGLSLAVGVVPGYTVRPGTGRDGCWPAEAGLSRYGSCIDQDAVGQGLGAGVDGNDLPKNGCSLG